MALVEVIDQPGLGGLPAQQFAGERARRGDVGREDGSQPAELPGREAAAGLQERRQYSRQRQAVIAANPELQERELIKLATLSAALADGLRRRGVTDPAASLAAETGIAVFKIAIERWKDETSQKDLPQLMRGSLDALKAMTAGR